MGVPTPSKQLSPFSLIVWVWWVMLLVVCVELMLLEKSRGVKGEQIPGYFAIMKTLLSETRVVSHCGLAIHIKKYLKAKEELWKLKYFTIQIYNLQKILQKKPKSFKIL